MQWGHRLKVTRQVETKASNRVFPKVDHSANDVTKASNRVFPKVDHSGNDV